MPKRRGTRLVAQQLLDDAAQDNELDYFGQFTKRVKPNNDADGKNATPRKSSKPVDDRAARIARREAAKLSHALEIQDQAVSTRRVTTKRAEEEESGDEGSDPAEEENEDAEDDEDGGPDGIDHDRITQAMNQARNRAMKPTINGIGRRRGDQPPEVVTSSDEGENSEDDLFVSQTPNGEDIDAPQNADDRSRGRPGANGKVPQKNNQRSHTDHDRPPQNDQEDTSSHTEDESEVDSPSEIESDIAEDSAFVEAPHQGETPVTVKVTINSMGGIFKTLQHQAWTGVSGWTRTFEGDNDEGSHKTCETASGKALMDEIQGLNDILGEATDHPQQSSSNDHGFRATIAYLRANSVDVQQHLASINHTVDKICSRELLPSPPVAGQRFAARVIKTRQALLRDISRRLIPMLIITVKKACDICPSEDNRSKTILHLDCFTLQFFLRPLAWANRLHKALQRCLEQWPRNNESQDDANYPDEDGPKAEESERKARSTLESQLDALHSAFKKAERDMRDIATQAESQEREAEAKRRDLERILERQRSIAAAKEREKEEQRKRDEKGFQAFYECSRALRSIPDPLKQLWDQSQAAMPEPSRAASTQHAAPGGSSPGQGQRTAGANRSEGGPSRKVRIQVISDSDSDDPFSDNYRPPPETSVSNRHPSSNRRPQDLSPGVGSSRRASQASRPWSIEEEKSMIRAIRYKKNYDVVSMAQKLRRSQDDVARKAAFLKQGYREAYMQKGVEIPTWAL